MLRIGFTNKYYTLWDVGVSYDWVPIGNFQGNTKYAPVEKINYCYLRNLSINEITAKDKASKLGCVNLEVDKELFGRNSSWEISKKLWCDLPKSQSPFFEYGKYRDCAILECTDLNYLKWYFSETSNIYARQVLLNTGEYVIYDKILHSIDEYNKIMARMTDEAKTKDFYQKVQESDYAHIIVNPTKNISYDNLLRATTSEGVHVDILFKDTKEMYYNGFTYRLPVVDGKAFKIKNKELVLLVKLTHLEYMETDVLEVVNIKRII